MDVVICLLDHGIAVDEALTLQQLTPLSAAARYSQIDMIRMLLRRGASLDRFDNRGYDACLYCMTPLDAGDRKAAPVDMLKVFSEHTSLDTNAIDYPNGATLLHWTAYYQSASEIDFLISHGANVEDRDRDGRNALYYAAVAGNPATYFTLLAHGSTSEYLARNLLEVIDTKAYSFASVTYDETDGPWLFDPILRDLLSRRADLMTSICVVDGWLQDLQGPVIPLQQAVAEYGPKTEAWFLGLLQDCGLGDEEDRQRLQELRIAGYDQRGAVIGEVDEESDYDSEEEGSDYDSEDEDPKNANNEWDPSSAGSESEDAEEEDESFWDAEEGA
jgi:hypothetical protein